MNTPCLGAALVAPFALPGRAKRETAAEAGIRTRTRLAGNFAGPRSSTPVSIPERNATYGKLEALLAREMPATPLFFGAATYLKHPASLAPQPHLARDIDRERIEINMVTAQLPTLDVQPR